VFAKTMPNGVGKSVKLAVVCRVSHTCRSGYARAWGAVHCLVTISDPNGVQPVFNDMRQSLSALGVQVEDTSTAARVVTRV
jgi:hypothetical protein